MPEKELMRVIAGKYRHRLLDWPQDENIRPTKDRVREAIFSSLGDITGKSFLDLYSGSGAMGIEAISRGASPVYFVDNNVNAFNCIKRNIQTLKINEDHSLYFKNDFDALKEFMSLKLCFDIVFLDPPYKDGEYENVISFILDNKLLSDDGIIITEANRHLFVDESSFKRVKNYSYRDTIVTIYRR